MWFKVDDQFHEHAKVRRSGPDVAAIGVWTLSGSWAGDNRSDGFVPESVVKRWTGSWRKHAATLVRVGLWEPAEVEGERGWLFHDWDDCNPTKDETTTDAGRLRWRRKNALSKNRELCERIVARDRSLCRYCGVRVNWADRRGKTGGTYDHVDPEGPNSLENVVVACRRCNGRKKDRTPDEARMPLRPEPGPWESTPESDPIQLPTESDLASPRETVRESGPGRVGTGSGTGSGGESVVGRVPALSEGGLS